MVNAETFSEMALNGGTGIRAVLILVLAYGAGRVVTRLLTHISDRNVEHRITIRMLIPVVRMSIYLIAGYYILFPVLQLSSTQLLAISGLAGAAIGFGLRDVFANVLGGLVMIFERPYRVGDKIEMQDRYGEVHDIGLLSTKLVTNDDTEIFVPNYHALTEQIANTNAGNAELLSVTELYVAHETDLDRAIELFEEGLITSKYAYVTEDHPFRVTVEDARGHVKLSGKIYVNDHRNEAAIRTDITRRVTKAFEEEGIERPEFGWLDE